MTVSEVIKKMVAYSEGNLHDINHFMKYIPALAAYGL